MHEASTGGWKQKRVQPFGKSLKLQEREKLLQCAQEPEHVQRGLDEPRLAAWEKWLKRAAADVIP